MWENEDSASARPTSGSRGKAYCYAQSSDHVFNYVSKSLFDLHLRNQRGP